MPWLVGLECQPKPAGHDPREVVIKWARHLFCEPALKLSIRRRCKSGYMVIGYYPLPT